MSLVVKMKVFLVLGILFATGTAFENDQMEESKVAIHEFKHFVPLKAVAEEIRSLDLVRSRRGVGFSSECINAGIQISRNCPFDLADIAKLYTGGGIDASILRNLYNILCNNDACYCGIIASLKFCVNSQPLLTAFEAAVESGCAANAKGTFCFEASLALGTGNNNSCLLNISSCASDPICMEYYKNVTEQYGCCIKDILDSAPSGDLFKSCGLPNPGNCQPPGRSQVCAPTSVTTSRIDVPTPTPPPTPPTDPPTPSPSPIPPIIPRPRCNRKGEEFVKIQECSGGVDIQKPLVFAQPLSNCEYQLYCARFCRLQKCMDNLVDLLQVCFNESGTNEGDSATTLDFVVEVHTKVYCAKDPERKDFCGVLFPEIMFNNPGGLIRYNLTCALRGNMCSSECSEEVERAIDHYGCCLSQFLKFRLRANPNMVYKRCNVTPPKSCRSKLKDPRAK